MDEIDWSASYNVQDAFGKTRMKMRLDVWRHSEPKFNARYQLKQHLHTFRRPVTPPAAREIAKLAPDVSYKNMPPPQDLDAPPEPPAAPHPAHAELPSHAQSHQIAVPLPPPAPPSLGLPAPNFGQLPPPPPPPPFYSGAPAPSGQDFRPPPPPHFIPAPPPPVQSPQPPTPAAPPQPAPSAQPSGVISREAVRYERPVQTEDQASNLGPEHESTSQADTPDAEPEVRTNAPGQKGFAQRYMEKMGWKKGEGLGKEATGITTILRHEPSKRKRKTDAEGGGWAQPAAMGRIVGGKRTKTDTAIDETKAFSIVAIFDGMLKDMDVDRAIEEDNLMQVIGEKMENYGLSERVYIDRASGKVFVKFTSALSAFNVSLQQQITRSWLI